MRNHFIKIHVAKYLRILKMPADCLKLIKIKYSLLQGHSVHTGTELISEARYSSLSRPTKITEFPDTEEGRELESLGVMVVMLFLLIFTF